jgi:hypothetical protein
MDAQQLVDRINLRHRTHYILHERYATGENQGAYAIYLAYSILAQLDWSIHHHSAAAVAEGVDLAHQILYDLEQAA